MIVFAGIKSEKKRQKMRKSVVHITYFTHATTKDNEQGVVSGWADAELSEKGKAECAELRKLMKNRKFDVVFCSDSRRATDSAELTFGNSIKMIKDERLREVNYGDFTGKPARMIDSIMLEHISKPFPNGECYMDVEKRVKSFLNDPIKNHPDKRIAVVSHRAPQLSLDVILKGNTWEQAIREDWRSKKPKEWKAGWEYKLIVNE